MFEIAMKMLFCLLIAALIGAVIGYLVGRMLKCSDKEDKSIDIDPFNPNKNEDEFPRQRLIESKSQEVEVEKVEDTRSIVTPEENEALLNIVRQESGLENEEVKPELLDAPRDGKADDLKEISGIGLKLEKVLNELGIYHFDQIARWTEKELNWIDSHLNAFKGRAKRENWIEQAKVLAEGGMTEFSQRVKQGEIDRY